MTYRAWIASASSGHDATLAHIITHILPLCLAGVALCHAQHQFRIAYCESARGRAALPREPMPAKVRSAVAHHFWCSHALQTSDGRALRTRTDFSCARTVRSGQRRDAGAPAKQELGYVRNIHQREASDAHHLPLCAAEEMKFVSALCADC